MDAQLISSVLADSGVADPRRPAPYSPAIHNIREVLVESQKVGITEDDNKGRRAGRWGWVGWCNPGRATRPITYGIYGEPGDPAEVTPGCALGSSVILCPVWSVRDHSMIRGLPDITDITARKRTRRGLRMQAAAPPSARRLSIGI